MLDRRNRRKKENAVKDQVDPDRYTIEGPFEVGAEMPTKQRPVVVADQPTTATADKSTPRPSSATPAGVAFRHSCRPAIRGRQAWAGGPAR